MAKTLLERLPDIVAKGRQVAEKILVFCNYWTFFQKSFLVECFKTLRTIGHVRSNYSSR